MFKLYEVRIDNNPGGWKSGNDAHVLVIAQTEEEAIEKVINGWTKDWDFNNGKTTYIYGSKSEGKEFISKDGKLSAIEIKFDEYDIIKILRETKLKKIIK